MITILGLVLVVIIILDGWTNKWAIIKSIGTLFSNTWKKFTGGS